MCIALAGGVCFRRREIIKEKPNGKKMLSFISFVFFGRRTASTNIFALCCESHVQSCSSFYGRPCCFYPRRWYAWRRCAWIWRPTTRTPRGFMSTSSGVIDCSVYMLMGECRRHAFRYRGEITGRVCYNCKWHDRAFMWVMLLEFEVRAPARVLHECLFSSVFSSHAARRQGY